MELLSKDQMNEYFKYVQIIDDDNFHWKETKAKKEHIDIFGIIIKENEFYYSKQERKSHSSIIRLSQSSMEKILYSMVKDNTLYQEIGKKLLKNLEEKKLQALSSLH